MEPYELTASQAAIRLQRGEMRCVDLARSCLSHIESVDAQLRAFVHIDPDRVLRQARDLDDSAARRLLHGLTLAIKDIIDVAGMPTRFNSPAGDGRAVVRDAACVGAARALGALILGKTGTVEFGASGRPAATRNAYSDAHTPGGSSAGSAAAVAARMAQIGFGTQTGGSIIRPAAYNGVYALKPTHGLVCTEGAKAFAPSLDTIGWFARSVEDLSLVARGFELADAWPAAPLSLHGLRIGLYPGPYWDLIDASGQEALNRSARQLEAAGARIVDLAFPAEFDALARAQQVIMHWEGRRSFFPQALADPDALHPLIRAMATGQAGHGSADFVHAQDTAADCRRHFDALFAHDIDVILTPPSLGQAPRGLEDTGSPLCNSLWTLLHAPCAAIPAGLGDAGLPVGIQLIGGRYRDAALLSCAHAIDAALLAANGPLALPARLA